MTVREIPPLPLDWRPTVNSKLKEVSDKLHLRPEFWFVPVFDAGMRKLAGIIDEEAVWRFLADRPEGIETREVLEISVGELISMIGAKEPPQPVVSRFSETQREAAKQLCNNASALSRFVDQYVTAKPDDSLADMLTSMDEGDKRLGIVFDERGTPTYFFTDRMLRHALTRLAWTARG